MLDHEQEFGIVHRDIKPANLLLDVQGILGSPISAWPGSRTTPAWTITGDLLGTLRYMSPEQCWPNGATSIIGPTSNFLPQRYTSW